MPSDPADAVVVIPLRSFASGNARLGSVLDAEARRVLARSMADAVVDATGDRPVVIVSSADDVRSWCDERSLLCIDDPGTLDAAAASGRDWARTHGFVRVVIAHADLPFATTFEHVAADGDHAIAVIVPDQRDDGTPVIALPAAAEFRFAYGAGSRARHEAEALRCGLHVRLERDPDLGFDVDVPEDLARLHECPS